jgi:hypothetical protein
MGLGLFVCLFVVDEEDRCRGGEEDDDDVMKETEVAP